MIGIFATAGSETTLLNRSVFIIIAASLVSSAAAAQATPTVRPDDPVYALIDKLLAARLVNTIILDQRTLSRREVARILAEAKSRLRPEDRWLSTAIDAYEARFREASAAVLGVDFATAESPSRGIEPDGNGSISVAVNPLLAGRLGRPPVHGHVGSLTGSGGMDVASWLAVGAGARVDQSIQRDGPSALGAEVEQGYARVLWKNVAVEVGRDYQFFGHGLSAGLTNSLNARGVDQVRIAGDRPFELPWILGLLGPMQGTLMVGDLGSRQNFPHARLVSYRLAARPYRTFEFGAGLAEQVGGQGSPPGSFADKVVDAFPLFDAAFFHRTTLFSNKLVAFDARWSLPGVRGLQSYVEVVFDDFDIRRARSVFTEDAGYVWGLSSSCFHECGPVRLTAEYHVTGLRYYTHGLFSSGYTVDDLFIGDPLGPRGRGGYATGELSRGRVDWRLDGAYESRSGDKYGSATSTTDDSDFHFIRLARGPTERRWRAVASGRTASPAERIGYRLGAGLERVENFAHVDRLWRTNWMMTAGIELRARRR